MVITRGGGGGRVISKDKICGDQTHMTETVKSVVSYYLPDICVSYISQAFSQQQKKYHLNYYVT